MHLPGSRLRLSRDVHKANPEGGNLRGKADQWFYVSGIYYPGEPFQRGSIGAMTGTGLEKRWSFWTNLDIDGAFIFDAEDVAELEIPEGYELPSVFESTPFVLSRKETH